MGLNEKQQRFVDEYIVDLNATQAAIRAGYSPKTAQEQGSRLLCNVMVAEAIQKAKKEREVRTQITSDDVVRRIDRVARMCERPVLKVDADGEAILDADGNEVIRCFDTQGALKALELLGKHTGAFEKDNHRELSGGIQIGWAE